MINDRRGNVRGLRLLIGVLGAAVIAEPAFAQQPNVTPQPTIEDLMKKIEALQHRVDELEGRERTNRAQATQARHAAVATSTAPKPAAGSKAVPATVSTAPSTAPAPSATAAAKPKPATSPFEATVPGLMPPEPMGNQFSNEDALRSDLPGLSIRIPGTDSQVRVYGFAKLSAWSDFNGRNQTDAPTAQTIPLSNSPADIQGGDYGMTARFSRIGADTRTLTSWGTLETRVEGDFGGGSPTSSNAVFRLRQAWAELGDESFRVLVGQANSLWNEGIFETLIDATNLNQSFIRQAQVRVTGQLASGLTGQVSLEAPETQVHFCCRRVHPGFERDRQPQSCIQCCSRPARSFDIP